MSQMKYRPVAISCLCMFLLILSGGICLQAQSNEGTEFWFSFLEHRDRGNSRMCMITSKYGASGTVSIPGSGWASSFSVSPNGIATISLPPECENIGSEQVRRAAVRVMSDQPSSVYIHQFNEFRSDAALVLPAGSLGREYYAMCYSAYENRDDHYPSEFLIVAMEDQTRITFRPSANTRGGIPAGGSLQIVLNRSETYQVQGAQVSDDLTGSHILSDKPVAVFSGNRWTQVPNGCGNRDNLLEQMYPVETWGREFIAVPSALVTEDIYRVIASENNTRVSVEGQNSGGNQTFLLSAGQWREFRLNRNPSLILSDKPINVAHFLVGGLCNGLNGLGDPSMLMLNSNAQLRDTVTLFNSPFQNILRNFINIACRSRDTASITVDGRTIASFSQSFRSLGPGGEYAFVSLELGAGAHTLISGGCGLIASAYGYGQAESYAYGGGANFYKINSVQTEDGACLGDSMSFNSGLPESRYRVKWVLGDGSTSDLHQFRHRYANTGLYRVKVIVEDLCRNSLDSAEKEVLISLRRPLTAYPDTLACLGTIISLRAFDTTEAKYRWTGPAGFSSDLQFVALNADSLAQSGIYQVTGSYFGCRTYPAEIRIQLVENPSPDLGPDQFFCPSRGESIRLKAEGTYRILWQDGSMESDYEVRAGGLYVLQLENTYGCTARDSILIEEICPERVFFPNAFSPNGDGVNDLFRPYAEYILAPRMWIFDRWGNQLWYGEGENPEWNGEYGGERAMPGVYVYLFQYRGYDEAGRLRDFSKSGEFSLIR